MKKQIVSGATWSFFGRLGFLSISLITNIWLARLLTPNEFGQVSIIMFFITLANILTESGLGGALIRKKDASLVDYSTVFVINLAISCLCFIVCLCIAGPLSIYYGDSELKNLLIVSAFILIIRAFQLTQTTRLTSLMKFKEQNIYRIISLLVSSVIGIILAYRGFGVWSLVIIQLLTGLINTIILWFSEGFFLKFQFSKISFKELYGFGINTTLASFLNISFENIYQLILAKYFSITQTGLYYQAKKLQEVPGGVLNMLTQGVIFSGLSEYQNDKVEFLNKYHKVTLYMLVFMGFISGFIFIYSKPIILILYGDKWTGAVLYMQILTVASFFQIQEYVNRVIFKVFDRTKEILFLEIFKKFIQFVGIIIGIYFRDVFILLIGFVITNIIGYFLNFYYSRQILGKLDFHEILLILKILAISIISVLTVVSLNNCLHFENIFVLFSIPIFLIFYILGIVLLKIMDIKSEFRSIIKMYNKK